MQKTAPDGADCYGRYWFMIESSPNMPMIIPRKERRSLGGPCLLTCLVGADLSRGVMVELAAVEAVMSSLCFRFASSRPPNSMEALLLASSSPIS